MTKKFENGVFTLQHIKCFRSILRLRNLKSQHSQVLLDLNWTKPQAGKSQDYGVVSSVSKMSVRFQIPPI